MGNSKFERPSFSFLPLVLLVFSLALWFRGCLPLSQRPNALSVQDRSQMRELVQQAAQAASVNEHERADALVGEAVSLLGGGSGAVSLVGDELIRQGTAEYATHVLTEAARDPETAQDPLLWVTLSRAFRADGDAGEAQVAENEASLRAQVILESVGQFSPLAGGTLSPEMERAVIRYVQAGNYYSEVRGDGDKALTTLREAFRLAPESPVTMNALGYTLADKGKNEEHFDEALELTKRAVERLPENGGVLDSYGWALYRKNDFKGALRVLEDAVEAEPDTPEIHYHFAMALLRNGQTMQAKVELDRALLLRPNFPEARRERDRLP